ncbi:MAG TPA: tryptophan synthase subunit alpha [Candidatus Baltobacteraceae bacterium]|nr:tryptophan synthase subunit alpha [Candidatus Baltobacteraceae bacterium]
MLSGVFTRSRPAFIPYVMAGDPDITTTGLMIDSLQEAGAAAIELGIPYGDPLADGPTIAAAGVRALRNGTGAAEVLDVVRSRSGRGIPIVLFTYFNPVLQYGIERFARDAAQAGAAAVIVPDIALEEGALLREAVHRNGLQMPLLVAPSTSPERAARIAAAATGFLYVVSRLGVTGAGDAPGFTPLLEQIAMLRRLTDKPLAVGFGISKPEHVAAVSGAVDGVIVGSALIDACGGASGPEAARRAGDFLRSLASAAPAK